VVTSRKNGHEVSLKDTTRKAIAQWGERRFFVKFQQGMVGLLHSKKH
jgi:hypothetical protein